MSKEQNTEGNSASRDFREDLKERFSRTGGKVETALNRSAGKESRWSWGLILLLAFVVFALTNLVLSVIKLFS